LNRKAAACAIRVRRGERIQSFRPEKPAAELCDLGAPQLEDAFRGSIDRFCDIDVRFLKSRRYRDGLERFKGVGSVLRDLVAPLRKSLIAFARK